MIAPKNLGIDAPGDTSFSEQPNASFVLKGALSETTRPFSIAGQCFCSKPCYCLRPAAEVEDSLQEVEVEHRSLLAVVAERRKTLEVVVEHLQVAEEELGHTDA